MRLIIIYFMLSNILALSWVVRKPQLLNISNLHVIRRYLISISIGPFIVIPFNLNLVFTSIVILYGKRLANYGKKLVKEINELDISDYDHVKYKTLKDGYTEMQENYARFADKYGKFQKRYIYGLATWLGKNYI